MRPTAVDLRRFKERAYLFGAVLIVLITLIINSRIDTVLVVVLSTGHRRVECAHDVHATIREACEDVLLPPERIAITLFEVVERPATRLIPLHDFNGAVPLHHEHCLNVILVPLEAGLVFVHDSMVHAEAQAVSARDVPCRLPTPFGAL